MNRVFTFMLKHPMASFTISAFWWLSGTLFLFQKATYQNPVGVYWNPFWYWMAQPETWLGLGLITIGVVWSVLTMLFVIGCSVGTVLQDKLEDIEQSS